MKLPRNVSGPGCKPHFDVWATIAVRQRGSDVRITAQSNGEHHEVIPLHHPVGARTLPSILKSVARHHEMRVEELLRELDL